MDIKDLRNTFKVCVKQCPDRYMSTMDDIKKYYKETGTNLCKYDFDYNSISNENSKFLNSRFGPCPELPVYNR